MKIYFHKENENEATKCIIVMMKLLTKMSTNQCWYCGDKSIKKRIKSDQVCFRVLKTLYI